MTIKNSIMVELLKKMSKYNLNAEEAIVATLVNDPLWGNQENALIDFLRLSAMMPKVRQTMNVLKSKGVIATNGTTTPAHSCCAQCGTYKNRKHRKFNKNIK